MLHILFLVAALLHLGVMSVGEESNTDHPRYAGNENMLGIPLPHGFEPTRDVSDSVYVLQVYCGPSYERFEFRDAPGAPEEVMDAVLTLLVDAGYKVQFVFDQFLEDRGIVIVTVFSPSGEEGYHLLFDYEKRLFHPVGPCPTRPRNELPGAP